VLLDVALEGLHQEALVLQQEENMSNYWKAVANILSEIPITRRDGSPLDPGTLEILAEGNGYLRGNIRQPSDMANAVSRIFYPQER
jgi:hypothetical protein